MPAISFHDVAAAIWPPTPNLSNNAEGLVGKLLDKRIYGNCGSGVSCENDGGGSAARSIGTPENFNSKRRGIGSVLEWLRGVALDPTDEMLGDSEMEAMILRARRSLFLRLDGDARRLVFPSCKKTGKRSSEELSENDSEQNGFAETVNQPRRRSERLAHTNQNLSQHLLSRCKRVGIGPTFQADVPERTCQTSEPNLSDAKTDRNHLRLLGHRVWPVEGHGVKNNGVVIGKGRSNSCACSCPGSVSCINSHIRKSTLQLKAELGKAFFDWGFNKMGEKVAASWRNDEQMRFSTLERLEICTECQNFWEVAEKYFSSKSKRQLVSYYFNVFLLRRMRNLSRLAPLDVNSDDEDDMVEDFDEKTNESFHDRARGKSRKKDSSASP